jgi:hypothetical protein
MVNERFMPALRSTRWRSVNEALRHRHIDALAGLTSARRRAKLIADRNALRSCRPLPWHFAAAGPKPVRHKGNSVLGSAARPSWRHAADPVGHKQRSEPGGA